MFLLQIGIVLSCAILISCQNASNPVMSNPQQQSMSSAMNQMGTSTATSSASSRPVPTSATTSHGTATEMPAYYDDELFTINFQELPPGGEEQALTNPQLNFIYQCDSCSFSFVSVIDAVPSDGMNPLWEEVQITFLTIPPQQFTSDEDILAAQAAGEISLDFTDEVYTCSVVGKK